jgi:hypothetical protein
MIEDEKPTGITYEDAIEAAATEGNVDFEGREVRVVSLEPNKSEMLEVPSVRLTLDLGNEYLVLRGYFNRGGEFIEKSREHPFQGPA